MHGGLLCNISIIYFWMNRTLCYSPVKVTVIDWLQYSLKESQNPIMVLSWDIELAFTFFTYRTLAGISTKLHSISSELCFQTKWMLSCRTCKWPPKFLLISLKPAERSDTLSLLTKIKTLTADLLWSVKLNSSVCWVICIADDIWQTQKSQTKRPAGSGPRCTANT